MTDIFFSYSSKDRDRVEAAHKALTERGFDVFWDLQVPAGIDWDRWIHAQLDQSRCVIVFWTANSAASDNVRHEVVIAREQGKLLQVLLEPLATRDLPMGALADQAAKLMKWCGDATDPEWAKLIAAVEEKATPRWLRQKVHGLEIALKGERQRVSEADTKARTLEEAHAREVAAQGDLRRERDKLKDERDQLKNELGSLTAKTDSQSGERQKLQAERDRLAASTKELTKERDALKAERDRLMKEHESAAKEPNAATHSRDWGAGAIVELAMQRDALKAERDQLVKERNSAVTHSKNWQDLFGSLAFLCSALVYLPRLIEFILLNWKLVDHQFEFVGMIHVPALVGCLTCFALVAITETLERTGALVGGALVYGAPIAVAWVVQYFTPFAGWWLLVYFILAVLGLLQLIFAYVLAKGFLGELTASISKYGQTSARNGFCSSVSPILRPCCMSSE